MEHIVIIGNGIAGITTARTLRKHSDCRITVISSESEYFISRTALMYVYMGHMKPEHIKPYEDRFWDENRIERLLEHVVSIDFTDRQLKFKSGASLRYSKLVLALGSKPNFFSWPGQELKGVQGLYSWQDLEKLEENTHPPGRVKESEQIVKQAVIVGGGLIGVELAEMLLTRNIKVTFLVRESRFWGNVLPKEEGELVMRQIRHHGVDLKLQSELRELLPDRNGRVQYAVTQQNEKIPCQLVGITAGVRPNVDFLKSTELEIDRGILVDELLQTNIAHVYAAGDCAQMRKPASHRSAIEAIWYSGRMMGEALGRTLSGSATAYKPGVWFNSAKFFDIEYQVYGVVPPEPRSDVSSFYWEHPNGSICLRVTFNGEKQLLGMHAFGLRLRHKVLDRWIRNGYPVEKALAELRDANFDPEFYRSFEKEVVAAYNHEYAAQVKLAKRSWKRILQA